MDVFLFKSQRLLNFLHFLKLKLNAAVHFSTILGVIAGDGLSLPVSVISYSVVGNILLLSGIVQLPAPSFRTVSDYRRQIPANRCDR